MGCSGKRTKGLSKRDWDWAVTRQSCNELGRHGGSWSVDQAKW